MAVVDLVDSAICATRCRGGTRIAESNLVMSIIGGTAARSAATIGTSENTTDTPSSPTHLPLRPGSRLDTVLGQSLRSAQPDQRL
jgi:hypothetical protein